MPIKVKPLARKRKITTPPKPFDAEQLAKYLRKVAAHGDFTKIHIAALKEGGFQVSVSCKTDNEGSWTVYSGRNPLDPLMSAIEGKMQLMRLHDK